jgi:hypothetical protein
VSDLERILLASEDLVMVLTLVLTAGAILWSLL